MMQVLPRTSAALLLLLVACTFVAQATQANVKVDPAFHESVRQTNHKTRLTTSEKYDSAEKLRATSHSARQQAWADALANLKQQTAENEAAMAKLDEAAKKEPSEMGPDNQSYKSLLDAAKKHFDEMEKTRHKYRQHLEDKIGAVKRTRAMVTQSMKNGDIYHLATHSLHEQIKQASAKEMAFKQSIQVRDDHGHNTAKNHTATHGLLEKEHKFQVAKLKKAAHSNLLKERKEGEHKAKIMHQYRVKFDKENAAKSKAEQTKEKRLKHDTWIDFGARRRSYKYEHKAKTYEEARQKRVALAKRKNAKIKYSMERSRKKLLMEALDEKSTKELRVKQAAARRNGQTWKSMQAEEKRAKKALGGGSALAGLKRRLASLHAKQKVEASAKAHERKLWTQQVSREKETKKTQAAKVYAALKGASKKERGAKATKRHEAMAKARRQARREHQLKHQLVELHRRRARMEDTEKKAQEKMYKSEFKTKSNAGQKLAEAKEKRRLEHNRKIKAALARNMKAKAAQLAKALERKTKAQKTRHANLAAKLEKSAKTQAQRLKAKLALKKESAAKEKSTKEVKVKAGTAGERAAKKARAKVILMLKKDTEVLKKKTAERQKKAGIVITKQVQAAKRMSAKREKTTKANLAINIAKEKKRKDAAIKKLNASIKARNAAEHLAKKNSRIKEKANKLRAHKERKVKANQPAAVCRRAKHHFNNKRSKASIACVLLGTGSAYHSCVRTYATNVKKWREQMWSKCGAFGRSSKTRYQAKIHNFCVRAQARYYFKTSSQRFRCSLKKKRLRKTCFYNLRQKMKLNYKTVQSACEESRKVRMTTACGRYQAVTYQKLRRRLSHCCGKHKKTCYRRVMRFRSHRLRASARLCRTDYYTKRLSLKLFASRRALMKHPAYRKYHARLLTQLIKDPNTSIAARQLLMRSRARLVSGLRTKKKKKGSKLGAPHAKSRMKKKLSPMRIRRERRRCKAASRRYYSWIKRSIKKCHCQLFRARQRCYRQLSAAKPVIHRRLLKECIVYKTVWTNTPCAKAHTNVIRKVNSKLAACAALVGPARKRCDDNVKRLKASWLIQVNVACQSQRIKAQLGFIFDRYSFKPTAQKLIAAKSKALNHAARVSARSYKDIQEKSVKANKFKITGAPERSAKAYRLKIASKRASDARKKASFWKQLVTGSRDVMRAAARRRYNRNIKRWRRNAILHERATRYRAKRARRKLRLVKDLFKHKKVSSKRVHSATKALAYWNKKEKASIKHRNKLLALSFDVYYAKTHTGNGVDLLALRKFHKKQSMLGSRVREVRVKNKVVVLENKRKVKALRREKTSKSRARVASEMRTKALKARRRQANRNKRRRVNEFQGKQIHRERVSKRQWRHHVYVKVIRENRKKTGVNRKFLRHEFRKKSMTRESNNKMVARMREKQTKYKLRLRLSAQRRKFRRKVAAQLKKTKADEFGAKKRAAAFKALSIKRSLDRQLVKLPPAAQKRFNAFVANARVNARLERTKKYEARKRASKARSDYRAYWKATRARRLQIRNAIHAEKLRKHKAQKVRARNIAVFNKNRAAFHKKMILSEQAAKRKRARVHYLKAIAGVRGERRHKLYKKRLRYLKALKRTVTIRLEKAHKTHVLARRTQAIKRKVRREAHGKYFERRRKTSASRRFRRENRKKNRDAAWNRQWRLRALRADRKSQQSQEMFMSVLVNGHTRNIAKIRAKYKERKSKYKITVHNMGEKKRKLASRTVRHERTKKAQRTHERKSKLRAAKHAARNRALSRRALDKERAAKVVTFKRLERRVKAAPKFHRAEKARKAAGESRRKYLRRLKLTESRTKYCSKKIRYRKFIRSVRYKTVYKKQTYRYPRWGTRRVKFKYYKCSKRSVYKMRKRVKPTRVQLLELDWKYYKFRRSEPVRQCHTYRAKHRRQVKKCKRVRYRKRMSRYKKAIRYKVKQSYKRKVMKRYREKYKGRYYKKWRVWYRQRYKQLYNQRYRQRYQKRYKRRVRQRYRKRVRQAYRQRYRRRVRQRYRRRVWISRRVRYRHHGRYRQRYAVRVRRRYRRRVRHWVWTWGNKRHRRRIRYRTKVRYPRRVCSSRWATRRRCTNSCFWAWTSRRRRANRLRHCRPRCYKQRYKANVCRFKYFTRYVWKWKWIWSNVRRRVRRAVWKWQWGWHWRTVWRWRWRSSHRWAWTTRRVAVHRWAHRWVWRWSYRVRHRWIWRHAYRWVYKWRIGYAWRWAFRKRLRTRYRRRFKWKGKWVTSHHFRWKWKAVWKPAVRTVSKVKYVWRWRHAWKWRQDCKYSWRWHRPWKTRCFMRNHSYHVWARSRSGHWVWRWGTRRVHEGHWTRRPRCRWTTGYRNEPKLSFGKRARNVAAGRKPSKYRRLVWAWKNRC